ncbi:hypothetical protein Acr_19g0003070 [Actinidia rufa]|uniref:Uncharacterized protein n=1 Tax=Actinidia rufa TaxID=165716 RepID=A0A7J0G990_9ERIC|nr:hypothetical protein Acr_19g0003070 [Actinidia rufa]
MFLAAVVLFGRTSPQAAGEKAGEGLLDYVAGQNQPEEVPTAEENHPAEVQSSEESAKSEKNM